MLPLAEAISLYEGTSALVILAFLPAEESIGILDRAELAEERRTDVEDRLETIRRDGFLAVVGARMAGVATISFPVRGSDGVFGAVTVSGPEEGWTMEEMSVFAPAMGEVVQNLSTALRATTVQ